MRIEIRIGHVEWGGDTLIVVDTALPATDAQIESLAAGILASDHVQAAYTPPAVPWIQSIDVHQGRNILAQPERPE